MSNFLKAIEQRDNSQNDLLLFDEIKEIERSILIAANEGRYETQVMTSIMTSIDYLPDEEATTAVSMFITEIQDMPNPGTSYTVDDELTIIGGQPVGVEFECSGVGVISGGSGYAPSDQIQINGGENTIPCVLQVDTVDGSGAITSVVIHTAGVYTEYPNDPVSTTKLSGGGDNTATFNLAWTSITNDVAKINVDAVDLSTGAILEYSILERGEYTTLPISPVSVSGGTGSNATFNLEWGVKNVHVIENGSGYLLPPTVEFSHGNAQAIASPLNGTMISSIVVSNTGYGYTTVPTVTLNPEGIAEEYYDIWKGIDTDRVKLDQMNRVIRHFEDKGYTIVRVINPITNQTFKWVLYW